MLFERAVASEGTRKMRLAVLLLCLMYGWAQEEVEEIIDAAEMAEIDAEFVGNATNVTFTENGENATLVSNATFTEMGGNATVVPTTTSPKGTDFDETDRRKGTTFQELFGNMKVCKGHARKTKIAPEGRKNKTELDCDVFVGHIWIDRPNETLPSSISRLRMVQGCITVWKSGLRELNLSSLSLLIYNEIRCRPYALRLVNNENLTSITFHENFTVPDRHLILVAGKHNLTEKSIKLLMGDQPLPKDSEGCREGKGGCVYYGDYIYSEHDERLSTLERIEGRLIISNTKLTNLSIFENLTVVGLYGSAVLLKKNYMLEDISSLFKMKLRGPEPVLRWLYNGDRWCHNKMDLKLVTRYTREKPYNLGHLKWINRSVTVDKEFLEDVRVNCSCGCRVNGSLNIQNLNGEEIDLTPLKNVYQVDGPLTITGNTRLYDLRFLENLNSIGVKSRRNDTQFELSGNVDLIDAYMDNLVKIRGFVTVYTCWELPKRTVETFKNLTQGKALIRRHETEYCTREEEQIVDPRPRNLSEPEKSCFAGNDAQLQYLLAEQSNLRNAIAQAHGNSTLTLCEHFYGYLKMHGDENRSAIGFVQQLKKITGCLDIVNVTNMTAGETSISYFEELDLTNLTEIDYDLALCGNFFALRIMRNEFLRRIDFNENLILNGAYFIRRNAEELEIYSGGKPNSTLRWHDPTDCVPEDPDELLVNCTNLIGPVFLKDLSPKLNVLLGSKIKRIYGQLIIRSTTTIYNLKGYENLTIIADNKDAVIIDNNKDLRDISALIKMNITLSENFPKKTLEKWKPVVVRDTGKLCLRSRRNEEDVRKRVSTPFQFSDFCRQRCAGGIVTDLTRLQSCQIVMGGLTIKDYDFESASQLLRYFGEIEDIEGQLIIMNNTGIKNLAFLKSLLRVSDYTTKRPIFRVADNPNLTSIEPLHKVELEYSHYEVHLAALIETYSKISDREQKELGIQGKVEFRVKERLHPTKGRRSKKKRDRKENADNLGVGIALSVGGCLIITIFGYGYSFFAYLREQRELKRQQQPGGGQAALVERAP